MKVVTHDVNIPVGTPDAQTGFRPAKKKTPQPMVESQTTVSDKSTDSRYQDISEFLPSRFMFYTYDTMSIRPFSLLDMKKLHVAYKSGRIKDILSVLGATINRNPFELTIGDVYYLMYWQRINSYKKTPLIVEFGCTNEEHIQKVINKTLPDTSLKNSVVVNKSNITTKMVDTKEVNDFVTAFEKEYGVFLFPTRMMDMDESKEDVWSDEDNWINKYASLLSPMYGVSLKERREHLEKALGDANPDVITDMDTFIEIVNHGVSEYIDAVCKECGGKVELRLSIDPHTFFPGL